MAAITFVLAAPPDVAVNSMVSQDPFNVSGSPVGVALVSPPTVPTTRSPVTRAVPDVTALGVPAVDVPVTTVARSVFWTPVNPSTTAAALPPWLVLKERVEMVAPLEICAPVITDHVWCQIPDPAVVVTPDPVTAARAVHAVPPAVDGVTTGAVVEAGLSNVSERMRSAPAGMVVDAVTVTELPAVVAVPEPTLPRSTIATSHHPSQ
jgi:hypothetical protein